MALIQGSGSGGGTQKPRKKRKPTDQQRAAKKTQGSYYPPQKTFKPPVYEREERGRPKDSRIIDPRLRPEPIDEQGPAFAGRVRQPGTSYDGGTRTTEEQVKWITDTYFNKYAALPDPVIVAQIMDSGGTNGMTTDQIESLFPDIETEDGEAPAAASDGDFMQITDPQQGLTKLSGITIGERFAFTGDTVERAQRTIDLLRNNKRSMYASQSDYLIGMGEMSSYRMSLYDRFKARGQKPNFDRFGDKYDPDLDLAARQAIFWRNIGYAINWSDPNKTVEANAIIKLTREGGFGKDQLEELAERLGIPTGTELASDDTVAGLFEAIGMNNSNLIRQMVWDGWALGRPVGQSLSQARLEYVAEFGSGRLPDDMAKVFAEENAGLGGVMQAVGHKAGDAWTWANKNPAVKVMMAPVAAVGSKLSQADTAIYDLTIGNVLQGITALGEMGSYASYGMSMEEYNQELMQHHGHEDFERAHAFSWDWGAFTDLSKWSRAWEDSEGNTPVTELLKKWDLESDGKSGIAAPVIGQAVDLGIIMYVSGKSDSLFWGNKFTTADKVTKAGKVIPGREIRAGIVPALGERTFDLARASHKLGWRVYQFEKNLMQAPPSGFILVSSKTRKEEKALHAAAGTADPNLPSLVEGVATLIDPSGRRVFVRVARRTPEHPSTDAIELQVSLKRNRRGPEEPVDSASIQDTADADIAARAGDVADVGDEEYIIRPLTWKEFKEIEPPMPGLTFRGGTHGWNPVASQYLRCSEGWGAYTTNEIYIASEYARGLTSGQRGRIYYIANTPKNPIDFDAPADEGFWTRIMEDVFWEEEVTDELMGDNAIIEMTQTYHGRVSDGKGAVEISDDTLAKMDKMKATTEWQRRIDDPEYTAPVREHSGVFINTKGHVSNGEVWKWILSEAEEMADAQKISWREARKIREALQENLMRRGYDANIHTEGLRRGEPHQVTVWFEQALLGTPTKAVYTAADGAALPIRARIRLLMAMADGDVDPDIIDALPNPLFRAVMEAQDVWNPDDSSRMMEIFERVAADEAAWKDVKYIDSKFTVNGGDLETTQGILDNIGGIPDLEHRFRYGDTEIIGWGDRTDLEDIPGALKNKTGIKVLTDDEAYQRYLDDFEEAAVTGAADPKHPLTAVDNVPEAHQGAEEVMFYSIGGNMAHVVSKHAGGVLKATVQGYVPPKWLSTNAELLVRITDSYTIKKLYGIAEDIPAAVPILKKIAASSDAGEIQILLRELEMHGVRIDMGGAAAIRGARLMAMERGLGDVGWTRIFDTMTTYGRSQPIETTCETIENVGSAIQMGRRGNKKETLKELRMLARRAWEADEPDKQAVVDEMWSRFKKNLGEEGVKELEKYHKTIYHARGQRYVSSVMGRSYHTGVNENGKPYEMSIVLDPKLKAKLPAEEAHAHDVFRDSHIKETKRLEKEVKDLEAQMLAKHGSAAPRKGSTTSGKLTQAKKDLAYLNRLTTRAVDPDIIVARQSIAELATRLGANEKDLERVADAVRIATARTQRYADANAIVAKLGAKKRLSTKANSYEKGRSEQEAWDDAVRELDEFSAAQPFIFGQQRKYVTHQYDPRITGWFMRGKTARQVMVFDQAVLEPIMRLFKETVMAAMGFPIRTNIGDELVRLLPEGVAGRNMSSFRRTGRFQGAAVRKEVTDELGDEHAFDDFDARMGDAMNGDWDTTGRVDEYMPLMPGEYINGVTGRDRYFDALESSLSAWAQEPIVKRILADPHLGPVGQFPRGAKGRRQVIRFMNKLRDETKKDAKGNVILDANGKPLLSDDALQFRAFLNQTNRADVEWVTVNGKHELREVFDTDVYKEWCNMWADRLQVIGEHELLTQAMERRVTAKELAKFHADNPNVLWPVEAPAPAKVNYGLRTGNPLYAITYANPFHYIYRYGTVRLLAGIGKKTKTALFNDRYHTLRNDILERNKKLGITMDPAELHRVCGEEALKYADRAAYSRSTTMFEDMARNMLPFISAYRQFWMFWGATALKHPFTMSAVREMYPEEFADPFALADGDIQYITPQIPFWGPTPEDEGEGLFNLMKNQLPQASFLGVLPGRLGAWALGIAPETLAKVPFFTSMDQNYAPFKRWNQLTFGLFNKQLSTDHTEWLFGDKNKLEKAHTNAVLSWLRYGEDKTGAEINWDKPWYIDAIESLTSKIPLGITDVQAEALFNEIFKTISPINGFYSPKVVRENQERLAKFRAAKTPQEKVLLRMNDPWLDTYLTYYECDAQGKDEMRHDPDNVEFLKWWASPNDWSNVGDVVDATDFNSDMFGEQSGKVPKDTAQLATYIHNMYTDIVGGVYLKGGTEAELSTYEGDIAKAKAEEVYKKKVKKTMDWALKEAKKLSEQNGWSVDRLMWKFENPGAIQPNGRRMSWGIWNTVIERMIRLDPKLTPYDFDVAHMAHEFEQNFGGMGDRKNKPYDAPAENILKAFNLIEYLPNPALARKLKGSSVETETLRLSRKEIKQAIIDTTTNIAADQWYYITAEQLDAIGIPADPKINIVQEDMQVAYEKWHQYKAGTEEYKNARNAYYALQRKELGGLKGGMALVGGLADRLEHIPHFAKPDLITIGSGKQAARQQRDYDNYLKVRNAEMKKKNPSADVIQAAWEKFAAGAYEKGVQTSAIERKRLEIGRVRLWQHVLEWATRYRNQLTQSHSDYYEAKGNSVASKYGSARAKALNDFIIQCGKVNPRFQKDLDTYFGGGKTLGSHLIDWYNY